MKKNVAYILHKMLIMIYEVEVTRSYGIIINIPIRIK